MPGDTQDGPLQDPGGGVFRVTGGEKIVVPGAGQVSEDDQEGSDTAEALKPIRIAIIRREKMVKNDKKMIKKSDKNVHRSI